MAKDKTGKKLERLVATLERVLDGTGSNIEAPSRRLVDRDTGKPREHDVLVTWSHGHHHLLTAVECRDRSRPVGVPDVEAFADKCAATGVNAGVIVSTTGFRETARKKAASRSITCMDLSEVEGFDWLGMEAIVGYQRDLSSIHFYFEFEQVPEGENLTLFDEAGLIVLDTAGVVVSQETLARMAGNAIPITASLEQGVGVVRAQRLIMETIEWRVRDRLGRTWPLKSIIADMTYTTTKIFNAIEAHTYSGGGKNYSFASAEVQFGEAEGRLLLLRNEDESTSVYFVPVSGSGWEVSKAEEIGG